MIRRILSLTLLIPVLSRCASPDKRSVSSNDPSLKIPAIRESAREHDMHVVQQLVQDLDSDDAAVRFYAIHGLKEITGNTFGYRYYDDEIERKPALDQWKKWLKDREATTQPSGH